MHQLYPVHWVNPGFESREKLLISGVGNHCHCLYQTVKAASGLACMNVGLLLGVLVRYHSWLWHFLTFETKFFFFFPLKILMMKATLKVTMVSFSFRVHSIQR